MKKVSLMHSLAMEAIFYQSSTFHKELSLLCERMIGKTADQVIEDGVLPIIEKTLFDQFGLTFRLKAIQGKQLAVVYPEFNKNSALIGDMIKSYASSRESIDAIRKGNGSASGTVSLRKAKVTGIYSSAPHDLYLGDANYKKNMYTAEEIAATILHEVGHVFVFLEFLSQLMTMNVVISNAARALRESKQIGEREQILKLATDSLKIEDLDVKELSNVKDEKVVELILISSTIRLSESQLECNIYDLTTWEMLADQFATRMGAGRHLSTALYKVVGDWNIERRSLVSYLFIEALKIVMVILAPFGFALPAVIAIIADSNNAQFDSPKARLNRIRNDIINVSKEAEKHGIDKETLAEMHKDIEIIDRLMKNYEERRQFFGAVADIFASRNRNQIKMEKELEQLIANELFLKSQEIDNFWKV